MASTAQFSGWVTFALATLRGRGQASRSRRRERRGGRGCRGGEAPAGEHGSRPGEPAGRIANLHRVDLVGRARACFGSGGFQRPRRWVAAGQICQQTPHPGARHTRRTPQGPFAVNSPSQGFFLTSLNPEPRFCEYPGRRGRRSPWSPSKRGTCCSRQHQGRRWRRPRRRRVSRVPGAERRREPSGAPQPCCSRPAGARWSQRGRGPGRISATSAWRFRRRTRSADDRPELLQQPSTGSPRRRAWSAANGSSTASA